jgi:glycosyltransferase involved in cell wall biosynthesis
MKVAGFTFVRNAIQYDYPVVESITSMLPLCDEVVVAVGKSDDDTLGLVKGIDSDKIRIIETEWDDSLRKGGEVLAVETMKAKVAISPDSDWCIYLQADEVLHEDEHATLRTSLEMWLNDSQVEGLLFDYRHFYGSYDYVGDSRKWYRKEVRIIRNSPEIYSWSDAVGFQKDNRPLRVKPSGGHIHHYGWVKHPKFQQAKQKTFNKLWHDDQWMDENIAKVDEYDYSNVAALALYEGTHPKAMHDRIARLNWKFEWDVTKSQLSAKYRLLRKVEHSTGWRVREVKNYEIV